jgi:hypothetical protein
MRKNVVGVLAVVLVALFSVQAFAAGHKPHKPPVATIEDLVGVWDVGVKELLMVGDLDAKKAGQAGTLEFFSDQNDPKKGSFNFTNGADGIVSGFQADCFMAKKGDKVVWHINGETDLEDKLVAAIGDWADQKVENLVRVEGLDVRSYAYKPIMVIKKKVSPTVGLFQVKGTVKLISSDDEGGEVTEIVNFKYQSMFKFGSKAEDESADLNGDEDLD